jgi:hypothetical protein
MTNTHIIKIVLFVCIVAVFGYFIGAHLSQVGVRVKEGARTLPEPQRHPNIATKGYVYDIDFSKPALNDVVDGWIAQYFDPFGYPLLNAIIDFQTQYAINGCITTATAQKMNDICYYILINVMPQIPTQGLPPPPSPGQWPSIQWTNSGEFALQLDACAQLLSLTGSITTTQEEGSSISGDFTLSTPVPVPTLSQTSDSGAGSVSSSSSNGGGDSGFCPTSCFDDFFESSMAATAASFSSDNQPMDPKDVANSPTCIAFSQKTNAQNTTTIDMPEFGRKVYLTDISQNCSGNNGSLNTWIQDTIKQYFDVSGQSFTGGYYPTQYAIDQFNSIVQDATPIDLAHKNKLRDLIYYFMERIIPGLPVNDTVGDQIATTYVVWKPIRWISNSDI